MFAMPWALSTEKSAFLIVLTISIAIIMMSAWLHKNFVPANSVGQDDSSSIRSSGRSSKSKETPEADDTIEVPDLWEAGPPPKYTIDLSLPPRERYSALAKAYKFKLVTLPILFDELLDQLQTAHPFLKPWVLKQIAKLVLRRVHDSEQMEEIIGVQRATGIPMYLLVAFNLLLDLLVGCTSGGVRTTEKTSKTMKGAALGTKMLHFRTLDWAMDPLREIVVELEFIAHPGGPVVARSVTYLGFVGVLTGVRPGLSTSFNFRSNARSWQSLSRRDQCRYIGGKLLVLLGRRPSIPCTLRSYIVAKTHRNKDGGYSVEGATLPCMDEITDTFPNKATAQCFVILSDGDSTTVIEKDWKSAVIRKSSSFIVCTNHDQAEETADGEGLPSDASPESMEEERKEHIPASADVTGMNEILEESVDRKHSLEKKWRRTRDTYRKKHPSCDEEEIAVPFVTVKRWITADRICAICTHFGVIMDPKAGEVLWAERYPIPGDWSEGEEQTPVDRWSI